MFASCGDDLRLRCRGLMVWIDAYERVNTDRAGVLCRRHADAMVVPLGWMLDDRRDPVPRLFKTPAQPTPPRRASGDRRGTAATTPNSWNSAPTSLSRRWPTSQSTYGRPTRRRARCCRGSRRSIRPTISTVCSRPAARCWRGRSVARNGDDPTARPRAARAERDPRIGTGDTCGDGHHRLARSAVRRRATVRTGRRPVDVSAVERPRAQRGRRAG